MNWYAAEIFKRVVNRMPIHVNTLVSHLTTHNNCKFWCKGFLAKLQRPIKNYGTNPLSPILISRAVYLDTGTPLYFWIKRNLPHIITRLKLQWLGSLIQRQLIAYSVSSQRTHVPVCLLLSLHFFTKRTRIKREQRQKSAVICELPFSLEQTKTCYKLAVFS